MTTELMDDQKYVNGLTDGWYDFKRAIEKTFETYKDKMTADQLAVAANLVDALNDSLTQRN